MLHFNSYPPIPLFIVYAQNHITIPLKPVPYNINPHKLISIHMLFYAYSNCSIIGKSYIIQISFHSFNQIPIFRKTKDRDDPLPQIPG